VKKGLSALAALAIAGSAQARELRVSQTDPGAYHTVQAAIEALPVAGGDIAIAPGTYREKLTVVRNGVHLHGSGKRAGDVVLVYGDAAATAGGTFKSATLTASGDDFRLANLTVQNDYWLDPQHPPSQAVALSVTGDRDVFTRVRLLGHQDTLLANTRPEGRVARQYFRDCYIEGHIDFIFGNAKAYFDRCEIHGLAHQSVIYTAQSKNAPAEDSGFVFDHCRLTAESAAENIWLGRPWRPYATVVFIDTRMDAPVMREGWREWTPGTTHRLLTATYAEYRSVGAGANPATRESYSHQLTADEARAWRLSAFFGGVTDWIGTRP